MSTRFAEIGPAQLAAAAAAVYTTLANEWVRVMAFSIANDTTTAQTYTFYIIPDGSSADATTLVVNAKTLAGGDSVIVSELVGKLLAPGTVIQGFAGAADQITYSGSVVRIIQ